MLPPAPTAPPAVTFLLFYSIDLMLQCLLTGSNGFLLSLCVAVTFASEGCVARITDRDTQSALEVALSSYQTQMQGCIAAPVTVSPTVPSTTSILLDYFARSESVRPA